MTMETPFGFLEIGSTESLATYQFEGLDWKPSKHMGGFYVIALLKIMLENGDFTNDDGEKNGFKWDLPSSVIIHGRLGNYPN